MGVKKIWGGKKRKRDCRIDGGGTLVLSCASQKLKFLEGVQWWGGRYTIGRGAVVGRGVDRERGGGTSGAGQADGRGG